MARWSIALGHVCMRTSIANPDGFTIDRRVSVKLVVKADLAGFAAADMPRQSTCLAMLNSFEYFGTRVDCDHSTLCTELH
eukprot:1259956-Amphidinium_carterae.1